MIPPLPNSWFSFTPRRQVHLRHFFVLAALIGVVLAVGVQFDFLLAAILGFIAIGIVFGWLCHNWFLAALPFIVLLLFLLLMPTVFL